MSAKQKIVHGRRPSNINHLVSLFAPLMFAELDDHFPLLIITMAKLFSHD